jgi:rubrerythrin
MNTNRDWIASELAKGITAECHLAESARQRVATPPDPSVSALYGEIAEADERHRATVETIATRFGHTPTRTTAGGLGEAITRLKDRVVTSNGGTALEQVGKDLAAKSNAIHWYNAWIEAFEAIGEAESARELAAIRTEEQAHRDALQKVLTMLVIRGVQTGEPAVVS